MFYSQELQDRQKMVNQCAKCEARFSQWSAYHTHVMLASCAKKIVPLNTSGRTKMQIVMEAESSWLKGSLIV